MTLPKAVVFLGGSATEVELIQAFTANDIRVVLVDRNANAPGREFADEFLHLSVTDTAAICMALDPLRSRYCFVAAYGIVDFMFKTVQVLTARLGIKPNMPEIYAEFTDKLRTKARLERFNIPAPQTLARGRQFDESTLRSIAAASRSGTVVVKAHDSCNSEGVRIVRIEQADSVRQALHYAIELSGEIFCEEYVSGTLHNLDVILSAGGASLVAITDRYRMADGLTSIAGFQQNPRQHALYAEFSQLAGKIRRMFSDYCGPLTADVLASGGDLKVLEISPHLHASKLQWLRDPRILSVWPRMLSGEKPELQNLSDGENASAYVRIYGAEDAYHEYFEPSWIADMEAFSPSIRFGSHDLRKILYMKVGSASLLREHLEAFVHANGGLATMTNHESQLAASG
jgi:phosphoribosylaminoimidazole carboxylase (NCAIR synthetase)